MAKLDKAERRTMLMQFMRDGESRSDMAKELGISQHRLTSDLNELAEEVYKGLDYRRFMGNLLIQQQQIKDEAMVAWRRSQGEEVVTKVREDEDGNLIDKTIETRDSAGNPQFLRVASDANDKQMRLLKVDMMTPPNMKLPAGDERSELEAAGVVIMLPSNGRMPSDERLEIGDGTDEAN